MGVMNSPANQSKGGRRAEVVGGGFAGLAAACALAHRGWEVRLHERDTELRTTGAGIYIYENGLRVLEALRAYEKSVIGAPLVVTREVRDQHDNLVSVHPWKGKARVYSIVRQQIINVLADVAREAGVEIHTSSEGVRATPQGELFFADGTSVSADLIVCADGVNSKLRNSLPIPMSRKRLQDGATRFLIPKTADELVQSHEATTIEYWSGTRRVLYTPCSPTHIYVALTMLDKDQVATAVPIDVAAWKGWFPHLRGLFERLGSGGRYDRFDLIKLGRWSAGHAVIVGDAAHALPPNIGQGAGCAMMNAFSMAAYLDRYSSVEQALVAWEREEKPLTEHTQRISVLMGMPTTWPTFMRNAFYKLASRSKWMARQRSRIVNYWPVVRVGEASPAVASSR